MKIITILAVMVLSLSACKNLPPYPTELKKFHQVMVKGLPISNTTLQATVNAQDLRIDFYRSADPIVCLEFDVVQINPYQFDYVGIVPFEKCHEVAGYYPDENVRLWNWIDDVFRKASKGNQNEP